MTVFLLLGLVCVNGLAKSLFVSPVGNDSNSGLTIDNPLKTIKIALKKVKAGDDIRLLPGTYPAGTLIENIHGKPENPLVIVSYSQNPAEFAVIDGGTKPSGTSQNVHAFDIRSSSWIEFQNLIIRNCWTDVIDIWSSQYLSFRGCCFKGGRRVIFPQGNDSHHILVENCFWEQDSRVWTTFDWTEMHHGSQAYYNGALLHPRGTGGSFVMRGNIITNVYNAYRHYSDRWDQDGNSEIYDNTITNVADNDFEPERWAWNLHYYHNRLRNIHKMYSIDAVKGGPIYIYGNIFTQSKDSLAVTRISGIWKFKKGSLTEPCFAFNNSYYTEAHVFQKDEATNHQLKHFNNAYYFFADSGGFILDDWNPSLQLDYDASNIPWPINILTHRLEQHGVITDTMFMDGPKGNLCLRAESPCIDGGIVMRFPELGWTQGFEGKSPDIGAWEGNLLVEGPPFRFREPPGGVNYKEKPRIVRHYIVENKLTLYFSVALNPETVSRSSIKVWQDSVQVEVISVGFPLNGFQMQVITGQSLDPETLRILFDPLPRGMNGEIATMWSSTIGYKTRINLPEAVNTNPDTCMENTVK